MKTFRLVLRDIRKVNHKITDYDDSYEPIRWNIEFIMIDGQRHRLSPEEAIQFNRRVVAWYSNIQGWPEHHEDWGWTVNHSECPLPSEILKEH